MPTSVDPPYKSIKEWGMAAAMLGVIAILMFYTSPTDGDFVWSDAPRHTLNGAFLKDLIAAMPLRDPRIFAENYYLKYPALSILFYPPLFSLFLAILYAIFGVSHAVAQAGVIFFLFLLGLGTYALARRWMEPVYALAVAILLVGAPEIAQWGRQVMLDIPCFAIIVVTANFFMRFLDNSRTRDLLLTVLSYVAALYVKQTPLFVAGALAVGFLVANGPLLLRSKRVIVCLLLGVILIIPLAILQLKFGQINTASVLGSQRSDASRLSIDAWTYYGMQLPSQLGWIVVLLACVYLFGALRRPAWRLPRAHMWFLLSWVVFGYLFFSYVMVREPRHDLMALLPIPLFAVLAIKNIARERFLGVGKAIAILIAVVSMLWSAFQYPVAYVKGYKETARLVSSEAPPNSVVLFSGNRDGTFVYNIRTVGRPDLSVARADKFLFRVAIERERGIQDRRVAPAQIEELIKRHGIRFVVFEPSFWPDMPSMGSLKSLLHDETKFSEFRRIATRSNFSNADKELIVYRYLGKLDDPPAPMSVEIVGIGKTIEQK